MLDIRVRDPNVSREIPRILNLRTDLFGKEVRKINKPAAIPHGNCIPIPHLQAYIQGAVCSCYPKSLSS